MMDVEGVKVAELICADSFAARDPFATGCFLREGLRMAEGAVGNTLLDDDRPNSEQNITTASSWYTVIVLCLALLISFTDRLVINLVVDPIRADLILTDFEVSLLQGAGFAVIFALAGLPCGRLADWANRRNVIMTGIALWSVATIACGVAGDFWSFFAARVAVGLGEAALVPAASALIFDSFSSRRRGIALGIFSLGATFGTGVAMFVGGVVLAFASLEPIALIGPLAPWRQMFVLVGMPGLLLLPLLLLIREPQRRHISGLLPLAGVLRQLGANNGAVLRLCLSKGALGIGNYAFLSWLPTLLQRTHGMTPLEAGGLIALSITTSGVIASLAGGALSDWIVRRWGVAARIVPLLGCCTLSIAGASTTFFAATEQQMTLSFAIWAFGSISGYVIGNVVMQENVPNEMRATTIALSLTITALLGIGLGPTLVPLVAEHVFGGEANMQPAMATVSLGAALLSFFVIWPSVRKGLRAMDG
ncbi:MULTISPECIES: MFS transporter [unclassified Mesorhizobium]|uniref:MFS transporter n=1 Tax=unclassified Mesorhizobium TaxID=325217 RepID=UPI001FE1CE6D|nr:MULTISPECIES: MFS transporter [unclassified Mesorhizobium]